MDFATNRNSRWQAELLLLLTTFFWGVTFVVVKEAIQVTGVFVFLAQRFIAAALLMTAVCLALRRPFVPRLVGQGTVMGIFLFGGYAFQTAALLYTTASNTAFLTGLNVVLVPVLGGLFHGHRLTRPMIDGVVLATAGLYLLCMNENWLFNTGDLLAAICAVSVALHLIYTGKYAAGSDVYWLTTIQLCVVALLSTLAALLLGDRPGVWHREILWALVICVLFATVFAFFVQTAVQRLISPTHTALILCMEPVFAALFAYVTLGERFGPAGAVVAFLIFAGMILAGIGNR